MAPLGIIICAIQEVTEKYHLTTGNNALIKTWIEYVRGLLYGDGKILPKMTH